jgi:TonB family protein
MRLVIRVGRRPITHSLPSAVLADAVPRFGVEWPSRLREFPGNLAVALKRVRAIPRLPEAGIPALALLGGGAPRPVTLFTSALNHIAVVALLVALSPLLRSCPTAEELARQHALRISWYYFSDELPQVAAERNEGSEPRVKKYIRAGRQTIVSAPARPDNDRQTIIQPDAPDIRIPLDIHVPNIVAWRREAEKPSLEYLPAPDLPVAAQHSLPVLPASSPRRAQLEYLPAPDLRVAQQASPVIAAQARAPALEYLPAPDIRVPRTVQAPAITAARRDQPALEYLPAPDIRPAQPLRLPTMTGAAPWARPKLDYLPGPEIHLPQTATLPPAALTAGKGLQASLAYLPAPDVRATQSAPGSAAALFSAGLRQRQPSLEYLPAPQVQVPQQAGARLPTSSPAGASAVPPPPPVAASPGEGAGSEKRLIVVSADPAPANGAISIPAGNRAGAFSIGPAGDTEANGARSGEAAAVRVPGLSISGGARPPSPAVGTVVSGPAAPNTAPGDAAGPRPVLLARSAPRTIAAMLARETRPQVGLPPGLGQGEQRTDSVLTAGKKIYTAFFNSPNSTSQRGSWVLRFSELVDRKPGAGQSDLTAPVPLHVIDPVYDPSAFRQRVEGVVILHAVIRRDGKVDSVSVVRRLDARLDESALRAFERWEFRPATHDGIPVDIEATVQVPFYHSAATEAKRR